MTTVPTLPALLDALPMRDIRERAGTYGNCGGVAFAFVHIERGGGPGIEVVDALEDLPDYAENWRDLIDELIGYIVEGITDGFSDALDGTVPPVRVLVYKIDPNPSFANPAYHRRAGRRVAEEALRRACPPTGVVDDLLRALPMRGIGVGSGTARVEVDLEATGYKIVDVVDGVPQSADLDVRYTRDAAVDAFRVGVASAFRVRFEAEPPVKVVIRRFTPGDDAARTRREARAVVEEVLRRLGG